MHYTTVKNPIHLVHIDDGIVYTFTGFEQLVHYWPWIRHLDIGPNFKILWDTNDWLRECHRLGSFSASYHQYILCDSFGDNIDPADVEAKYCETHPTHRRWKYNSWAKRRRYRLRRIRTTHERRWVRAWDDEEFAPKIRARRNARNLPDSWDDYVRRDVDDRNWKRHRRHQWKEK